MRQAALVAALALFVAAPAVAEAKKTITISGSTSVFPLETKLARAWIKTKAGSKFAFRILQGGSNVGVADVAAGRVSIGGSSRDPAAGDPGGLVFTRIAKDALCIITNNANPMGNISAATVRNIFVGPTYSQWNQVPGTATSGAISAIGRAPTSGTHDAFRTLFLSGTNQGGFVQGNASNGLVQQGVQSNPQGIGYVSYAFLDGVHMVPYEGVNCDLRNAKSGVYLGTRSFYLVTQGAPAGPVAKFINWVRSNRTASKVIATEWVPLR